jgi:hypothetical protein
MAGVPPSSSSLNRTLGLGSSLPLSVGAGRHPEHKAKAGGQPGLGVYVRAVTAGLTRYPAGVALPSAGSSVAAGQGGLRCNGPVDGYHEDHFRRTVVAPLNGERSEASVFDPFAGGADQRVWTDGPMPGEPDDRKSRREGAPEARRLLRVGKEGVGDAIVSSAFGLGRHTLDGSR